MIVLAAVLAALAAVVHVYIFILESIRWEHPATRRIFGTSVEQAATTKPLAFNQGFYNLFLAVVAAIGAALLLAGRADVGAALVLAGAGSMLLAALVLLVSSPDKRRAAVTQGALPALAVIALAIGLVS
jgi:putative membrane protein